MSLESFDYAINGIGITKEQMDDYWKRRNCNYFKKGLKRFLKEDLINMILAYELYWNENCTKGCVVSFTGFIQKEYPMEWAAELNRIMKSE
jgi:hypothetical protein